MTYKLLILAPSAGGKSTLMRYLREHTSLHVVETDEEVVRANNGDWPEPDLYQELIRQTANEVITRNEAIYLMKDMPIEILRKAKDSGFKVVVLKVTHKQLLERNRKRMKEEGYDDATQWFKGQLDELDKLGRKGLIDEYIDGNLPTAEIAKIVESLVSGSLREI